MDAKNRAPAWNKYNRKKEGRVMNKLNIHLMMSFSKSSKLQETICEIKRCRKKMKGSETREIELKYAI